MTGIILTFLGMQPTGNETKTSVCTSTHISITGRGRVFTLLTEIIHHDGGALHVDCVSNQGSRWHSSWCKEFITSVWMLFYQNPQPCSLDVHCTLHGPYARHFACTSGRRKGRGTSLGITTSFLQFWCCFTSSRSYQAFFWLLHLSK